MKICGFFYIKRRFPYLVLERSVVERGHPAPEAAGVAKIWREERATLISQHFKFFIEKTHALTFAPALMSVCMISVLPRAAAFKCIE